MTSSDFKEALMELKETFDGEVRDDPITLAAYSVDASIYEIIPFAVATPKTKQDILKTLALSNQYKIPVIPRGAATGIAGGCLGRGIILDLSKYFTSILKIDSENKFVICQPGVIQDSLNAALSPFGYRLGPDTSTGNRATLGGMLANNAAGAHSLRFGKMADHVQAVEVILMSGEVIRFEETPPFELARLKKEATRTGLLYRTIDEIREAYTQEIADHFPNIPRLASGYNLRGLLESKGLNLAKLIAGSEGTLGITTEIQMAICKKLGKTSLCAIFFHDMIEGMRVVPEMLKHQPVSLEMLDEKILKMAKSSPSCQEKLEWVLGEPQCVFIAEFDGLDSEDRARAFNEAMSCQKTGYARGLLTTPLAIQRVWDVRKAGLGLLLSKRTYSRAIAFLEDLSVPPENLASFMQKFKKYLDDHNKEAGIYGHVGAGCMHIRPYIDLRKPEELQLMHQMMLDISSLVLEYGGALSGEHGDGLVRSWLNEKMFGKKLYKAFCEIKHAFDEKNLLNPGKIVHGPAFLNDLRLSPDTKIQEIKTFQDFSPEGGFALAVDLCNGNGQCRKREGLMCPSFQATGDEFDTTRARAQALRAVINGRLKIEDFTTLKVFDVLDLCLQCKGCKTECPSQVDMAKIKTEFLYQFQEKHGYSLRSLLLGHIGNLYSFAHPMAKLFNFLSGTKLAKVLLGNLGISKKRKLPLLANERFSALAKTFPRRSGESVVLFSDTFTEFNEPWIGRAAFEVLSALGFNVIVPRWTCCGRPLISKGLLKQARKAAESLILLLHPYAAKEIPIIGLEPSCIFTLIDDFPSIAADEYRQKALEVARLSFTLDQFLQQRIDKKKINRHFSHKNDPIKIHTHCHQKALADTKSTLKVLSELMELNACEINSGCCGMAGSFGYEKEHYEISMKIGSMHLFPSIQNSEEKTIVIANGFSCRSQIEQGTTHKALHLCELLSSLLINK